ncbi:11659_t:CDS:2, partial [Dentiscutata heterogama]
SNTKADMDIGQITVTEMHNSESEKIYELEKSNTKVDMNMGQITATEIYNSEFFKSFLETIKNDYENGGSQLQASLEKLAEQYNSAKAKSILVLTSFLHNIKPNNDLLVRIKSGARIHVQIESVKCRKTGLSTKNSKENVDPHIIPACKVRAVSKKKHNISQNISKNQIN